MSKIVLPTLAAFAAFGLVASPVLAEDDPEKEAPAEMTKGEKKLAKLLEGRVAGEPQRCIRNYPSQRLQVIDNTAYVYGNGRTIYVQRTKHPEDIDDDDILVLKTTTGSQLCRLDNLTTIDRYSGFFTGAVFLEDFVPYTRIEDNADG
jgi:hypothetical protein